MALADERRQAIEGVRFLINRDCDGLIVMSNALLEKDIVAFGREQPNIVVLNRDFPAAARAVFFRRPRAGRRGRRQGAAAAPSPASSP